MNIAKASMGEETFNGLSILRHHWMNFETIKIPFLAGLIAPKMFIGVNLGSSNPNIITDSNRQAINHIDRISIQGFPYLTSKIEEDDKEFFHTVQSSIPATFTQHLRDVTVLFEHGARAFLIPAEE